MASSAAGLFPYPTGRKGAELLGYDPTAIAAAPAPLLDSFCGVGNPFSLGAIPAGTSLLDFGCGAGFDLFVAGCLVGSRGLLCGIDLSAEMINKAGEHLRSTARLELRVLARPAIPYPDAFFDVVISNGAINLTICKERCFAELYRVLKPGGRIQFADMILNQELPLSPTQSIESWFQ